MSIPFDYADLGRRFEAIFDRQAEGFLFSPGRVNLIGEHIDYCGGLVLPMAISRGSRFAWAASKMPGVRIHSERFAETARVHPTTQTAAEGRWTDYVAGVMLELGTDAGADIYVTDDIASGGLSSSASFSVGVALVLAAVSGREVSTDQDRLEIAQMCRRAENEFVGVPCGIMDQASVVLGGVIKLDCATLAFERVSCRFGSLKILVMDTGKPRVLAASKYRDRVAEISALCTTLGADYEPERLCRQVQPQDLDACCGRLEPVLQKRLRHVVTEQARVEQAFDALSDGDMVAFGRLMSLSHESLRIDYEVTGPELDEIVIASLAQPGVLGARMTGAGFGGCAIALVESDAIDDFTEAVVRRYYRATGLEANIFAV